MASKDHTTASKNMKKIKPQGVGIKSISSTSTTVKSKNPKPTVPKAVPSKESKLTSKLTAKTHPSTSNKVQQLPQPKLRKEVPDILCNRAMPVRVPASSRKRTLSTKHSPKTKSEPPMDNQTPEPHSTLDPMALPKLRTIIDNMTSFVTIDHEKIYPLLNIFIDYILESLPDRVKRKSLTSVDLESMPEEFQEKLERFERQKIMDPLISPGVDLENSKDYEDNFMEHKLNYLLPILRKCNGNVNFVDKNGQTILHIFIRRYVVVHKILQKEDLDKPEYQNSPQMHLRKATFHAIEELLSKGASVNIADAQGNTPLHSIVKYEGYEEMMSMLLKNFKDVDAVDKNGDTVLHLMLGAGDVNEKNLRNIDVLVAKNPDLHKRNNNGMAPIHIAFEHCLFETFGMFEKKCADFHFKTKDNKAALHLVCKSSTRDDVRKLKTIDLLINKGIDINAMDKEGYSAMHYSVKYSTRIVIEKLINFGANAYCQTKEMNLTPLHLASQYGCAAAINTLVQAGIEVNIFATGGIIPLHLALLHSDPLTVECLIVNGADVYRRDAIFGFTPAHMTAFVGRKMLDLLVRKGADVNVKNGMGVTPLHLASMLGNVDVIEGLCEHGADVNCRDSLFGMTALHWASMKGKRLNLNRIVDGTDHSEDEVTVSEFWKPLFLRACQNCDNHDNIETNVRTMLRNNHSSTTVVLQPQSEAMKLLLKFGAHADVQDDEGRVAVHNVVKSDNVEGMKHLMEFGLDFNDADTSRWILETWNSVKVRSYVLWNAMKLRIAGLPIADVYVSKVVKPQFQSYYGYWEEEVKKLKRCMVDEVMSVHDVMCMKSRKRYKYVERVMQMHGELEMKFPDYCGLVFASCRQAVARMELEKSAKMKLLMVADDVRLEDVCCERIFEYLSNVDLRAFIEGFEDVS